MVVLQIPFRLRNRSYTPSLPPKTSASRALRPSHNRISSFLGAFLIGPREGEKKTGANGAACRWQTLRRFSVPRVSVREQEAARGIRMQEVTHPVRSDRSICAQDRAWGLIPPILAAGDKEKPRSIFIPRDALRIIV